MHFEIKRRAPAVCTKASRVSNSWRGAGSFTDSDPPDAKQSSTDSTSVSSFFNSDDTKLEYKASEPVNDRER